MEYGIWNGRVIIDVMAEENGSLSMRWPRTGGKSTMRSGPYKQIVIAAGEGSKAALSAFDYLIGQPLPAPVNTGEEVTQAA